MVTGFKIKSAVNGVFKLAAFVYNIFYPCILSTEGRDVLIILYVAAASSTAQHFVYRQREGGSTSEMRQ